MCVLSESTPSQRAGLEAKTDTRTKHLMFFFFWQFNQCSWTGGERWVFQVQWLIAVGGPFLGVFYFDSLMSPFQLLLPPFSRLICPAFFLNLFVPLRSLCTAPPFLCLHPLPPFLLVSGRISLFLAPFLL